MEIKLKEYIREKIRKSRKKAEKQDTTGVRRYERGKREAYNDILKKLEEVDEDGN